MAASDEWHGFAINLTLSQRTDSKHKATLIIGEKFGRLGNRLWLFAHVVAYAMEHGLKVWNPCFDEYSEYFGFGQSGLVCGYPVRRKTWKAGTRARHLTYALFARLLYRLEPRSPTGSRYAIVRAGINSIYDLAGDTFRQLVSTKRYVILVGWRFRDYAAFEKHSGAIRKMFRPSEQIALEAETIASATRADADVVVGIHIRQSDYREFLGGAYYFPTSAYAAVLGRLVPIFHPRRVRFLICSDETQDESLFSEFDWTRGTGHPAVDMTLLARCDYIVGPPSTFTMWASFYGKTPLYRIRSPDTEIDLNSFEVIDGGFDLDADPV